ncbi:TIGR04282 family arsenosugar biosynthesis glycosyltransferase [Maritimibacter sp. DP1N21-5]|uniref:TIGR04282 family arsenosugar biosynthesis glycosyltransferase n=1 Tax=Maritimibacter sp. DP1N21-5 TaxID=2836867 RepID=UPI001C47A547|nr:TIGR04282 family arsenosugar biosynthesis glycosyltransferase [Maritimibacter sp. DP1N21-5]MBV7408277.1 TIGR04282 family arsenosugar biosynthesis glycosyltransferase [Maritimibacter sp. DP1N21-5]
MSRPRLVVMTKEPRPGRVKTRLAADIGALPAAYWTRQRLHDISRNLTSAHWTMMLAVAPDSAVAAPLLPGLPRLPQGPGDLGDRMARVFRRLPRGPVLIIGTDIPGITRPILSDAFRALARHRAVIGPASDGGFWAIGLDTRRRIPANLFAKVRWSTEHALADTLVTLPSATFLPTLDDVDTVADLATIFPTDATQRA